MIFRYKIVISTIKLTYGDKISGVNINGDTIWGPITPKYRKCSYANVYIIKNDEMYIVIRVYVKWYKSHKA